MAMTEAEQKEMRDDVQTMTNDNKARLRKMQQLILWLNGIIIALMVAVSLFSYAIDGDATVFISMLIPVTWLLVTGWLQWQIQDKNYVIAQLTGLSRLENKWLERAEIKSAERSEDAEKSSGK